MTFAIFEDLVKNTSAVKIHLSRCYHFRNIQKPQNGIKWKIIQQQRHWPKKLQKTVRKDGVKLNVAVEIVTCGELGETYNE